MSDGATLHFQHLGRDAALRALRQLERGERLTPLAPSDLWGECFKEGFVETLRSFKTPAFERRCKAVCVSYLRGVRPLAGER